MIDVPGLLAAALQSPWLLPLLTLAVTADGPMPLLPSEPLLFGAVATAAGAGDATRVVALAAAAFLGSLLGDALLYGAGRSSRRVVPVRSRDGGLRAWVCRHLHRRPVLALTSVRLVPGGRLVGVSAAGRVRVPVPHFALAAVVSSLVWAAYMTGVGLLLQPLTGGDPLLSLLAGLASAAVIATAAEVARRLARRRGSAAPG